MRPRPDPVKVLRHALRAGDEQLADLLIRRLAGRVHPSGPPSGGVARTIDRLSRWLAARPRD